MASTSCVSHTVLSVSGGSIGRAIDSPSLCSASAHCSPLCGRIRHRRCFRGIRTSQIRRNGRPWPSISAMSLDFTGSFFEGGNENGNDTTGTLEELEKGETPKCPPGLRHYETMAVLRPDISEEDRLGLTQRYEEIIVAGGGMGVEVFNRGVMPLAYSIKKKNLAGVANTYLDGIYLLFTYFTKPESVPGLEKRLKADDDIIRSSTFKVQKQKK